MLVPYYGPDVFALMRAFPRGHIEARDVALVLFRFHRGGKEAFASLRTLAETLGIADLAIHPGLDALLQLKLIKRLGDARYDLTALEALAGREKVECSDPLAVLPYLRERFHEHRHVIPREVAMCTYAMLTPETDLARYRIPRATIAKLIGRDSSNVRRGIQALVGAGVFAANLDGTHDIRPLVAGARKAHDDRMASAAARKERTAAWRAKNAMATEGEVEAAPEPVAAPESPELLARASHLVEGPLESEARIRLFADELVKRPKSPATELWHQWTLFDRDRPKEYGFSAEEVERLRARLDPDLVLVEQQRDHDAGGVPHVCVRVVSTTTLLRA